MNGAQGRYQIGGAAAWWVGASKSMAMTVWQRSGASLAALFLYLMLAIAMLSPLASDTMPETPANDLANHVSGIIEARNALVEGQFPIRVAPNQNNHQRYPIFQFYGNFPYTVSGLFYLITKLNPYQIWKLIVLNSLIGGGFFTFRSAFRLTNRVAPAVVSGAVFITAPYFLTDILGRFAYPEIVSFGLLPVTFFYLLRAFMSRRLICMLLSAISWSFLALSHNITFVYASLFFPLFLLMCSSFSRKSIWRMLRVGMAYLGGLCLAAWYFVPQLYLLPQLVISTLSNSGAVYQVAWLTPLYVLLSPTLILPVPPQPELLDNPYFGLQVGWPILLGVGVACYYLMHHKRLSYYHCATLVRLLLLFAVAFFMVWTPFDFWQYLPKIFSYVQFSYRLLMFVVLWGALITAYALSYLFPRGMHYGYVVAAAAVLVGFAIPYLAPHPPARSVTVQSEIDAPNMGRGGANVVYSLATSAIEATNVAHTKFDRADWDHSNIKPAQVAGYPFSLQLSVWSAGLVQLPVFYYPGMIQVRDNGYQINYSNLDGFVSVLLEPGDHIIATRFVGVGWANTLSLWSWIIVLVTFVPFNIQRLRARWRMT